MIYVSIFGIIQSIFFSFLLFNKRKKDSSSKVLLYWFIFFGIHFLIPLIIYSQHTPLSGYMGLDAPLYLFHLFFLDLYISTQISEKIKIKKYILTLITPVIVSVPFYIQKTLSGYDFLNPEPYFKNFSIPLMISTSLLVILGYFYLYRLWIKYLRFKKKQKDDYSYDKGIDLKWIKVLIISLSMILILITFTILFMVILKIEPLKADELVYLLLLMLLYWIGFSGIKQGSVFNTIISSESQFNNKSINQISIAKLNTLLEEEKLYTNPTIRLKDLSDKIAITPQHLSYLINNHLNCSFYDYINMLRVNEICRMIESGSLEKYTLLSIALDAGFNSKASFNRNFKKIKKVSPSTYIKNTK